VHEHKIEERKEENIPGRRTDKKDLYRPVPIPEKLLNQPNWSE
jgi:hypothetical protein